LAPFRATSDNPAASGRYFAAAAWITSKFAQEEIKTIFPTKTIEYLISGRPILAHLPADCFLAEFLRSHDCALIVDEPSLEALKRALAILRQDEALRSKLVCNAMQAAKQFEAHEVARQMRDTIQHLRRVSPF